MMAHHRSLLATATRTLALLSLLILGACSSTRPGGYYQDDGPDKSPRDVSNIPDAVPKSEPRARSGNKEYVVFGKTYVPLADASGYRERGVASWYGKKFHGQRTSSGEPYDMYTMSAAHRTLPLPSYVRVRNLENGRTAIVRVNDRGPFLHNRVIDLSYAAATKLGIVGTGTGLVEVETVTSPADAPVQVAQPPKIETRGIGVLPTAEAAPLPPVSIATASAPSAPATAPAPATPIAAAQIFVQAGAFRDWNNAEALRLRLERAAFKPILVHTVLVDKQPRVYRVRIGPIASVAEGDRLTETLARHGVDALIVVE
jgi:peptidoglycan lytic transglycosylase